MKIARVIYALLLALLTPLAAYAQGAIPTPVPGELVLSLRNHEGKYLTSNLYLSVHRAVVGADGVVRPEQQSVVMLRYEPNAQPVQSVKLAPGKYVLRPSQSMYQATRFAETYFGVLEIESGKKTERHPTLARFDYVSRTEEGNPVAGSFAVVYQATKNANGEPLPPKYNFNRSNPGNGYEDGLSAYVSPNLEVMGVDIFPGTYTWAFQDEKLSWHFREITLESSVRYLICNLPDWPTRSVPGWYYTQTGANQGGYSVTNEAGVPLWDEYQRLGGSTVLGYPVSNRYLDPRTGVVYQATQRGLLRWNRETGRADLVDLFSSFDARGESWLSQKGIPLKLTLGSEEESLALLNNYWPVQNFYLSNPLLKETFGLPEGIAENPEQVMVRLNKAVLQLWLVDKPWAKMGEVTFMNVGDLAKEVGMVSTTASLPSMPL